MLEFTYFRDMQFYHEGMSDAFTKVLMLMQESNDPEEIVNAIKKFCDEYGVTVEYHEGDY